MSRRISWIVLAMAACDGGAVAPEDATFERVRAEVFGRSCNQSVCHGQGAGDLDLTGGAEDFDAVVGVEAEGAPGRTLVVPGDPDASYLLAKMRGDDDIVGELMPQGAGEPLAEAVALVEAWIAAGAPDGGDTDAPLDP